MPLHDFSPGVHDEQDDGWVADTDEAWAWASTGPDTFTVSGDQTGRYTPGTRIKLTQTTVKYFVVAAASFSAGTTTVTITGGTDYSLANAAISANFHSYAANPQGYPGWFNWSPSWSGFSSNPTIADAKFAATGRLCTVLIYMTSTGTSNATNVDITNAPLTASPANSSYLATIRGVDNGANVGAQVRDGSSGTQFSFSKGITLASWTSSGGKGVEGVWSYAF